MKLNIALLLTFICFVDCSCQGRSAKTTADNDSTVHTSNIVANENRSTYTEDATKNQTGSRKNLGNFRVDAFIDNKLVSRSTYRNGLCIRYITFNTETKRQEGEVEYFYRKNGELDHTKVIQGDESREAQLVADKSNQDFLLQSKLLESRGIEFPLPDIVADEVRDLSKILAVADNYSDFKTETQNDGTRKIIRFGGFNKNVRFQPSTITLVAGNNPIHIKDFELALENNFPIKESLKTDDGELTKTYSYKEGRLTGVVYKFTDLQNQSNSLEKRFEYHELNQKP